MATMPYIVVKGTPSEQKETTGNNRKHQGTPGNNRKDQETLENELDANGRFQIGV